MDQIDTRTLHELVEDWAESEWNGSCYIRIARELWDSMDAYSLIESPFGVPMTLLESCIVDASEAIESGQITKSQALERLRTLLENDDFFKDAKTIEVSVNTNPVCRISNADYLQLKVQSMDYRKPLWWKRSVRSYWFLIGVVPFASMLIIYSLMINLGILLPIDILLAVAIGVPMYGLSYYIRTVNSKRLHRTMFILIGSCFIGFWFILVPLTFLLVSFGVWSLLGPVPWWLGMPLVTIPPLVAGAFIGDWLGKRRDYRPYM